MPHSPIVASLAVAALSSAVHAQLVTAYTGDEGGEKSWIIDVETGENVEGPFGKSRALAADPATNRIFQIRELGFSGTVGLRTSEIGADGSVTSQATLDVRDVSGDRIRIITSLAFGDGVLYAYDSGSGPTDPGLGVIDLATGLFTTILRNDALPVPQDGSGGYVRGLTFDTDRGRLLIGTRNGLTTQATYSVYDLDPLTGDVDLVVTNTGAFDGLAYGRGRIFLDCGAPCGPLKVFNTFTGAFEPNLPIPRRFGNGSGGATFLEAFAANTPEPCSAADLSAPLGTVDLNDADAFIASFLTGGDSADVAGPFGVLDLDDVDAFVGAFLAGCP